MLSLYVHAQYARRAELLVAEDADEWFVAGMRAYVCLEIAALTKRIAKRGFLRSE